ncbi:MAG: 1,4-dihydroxy-2-naphthoate octaprenyltransferase [Vulcanisaeta sp.]|jgi:1,4-dihydroxy-2-naphthoate octaprenyltransferase|uniref:1,4-dihydroxy-2-naphthoate octaprenyltransferase n=1 Tax=Vulcanisaeta sp. TaxID=2020871 RepID=UPI003D0B601A
MIGKVLSYLQAWTVIVRAWSMPMTIASISLGAAYAYYLGYRINIVFFTLALIGALLLHMSVNVINDYYDTLYGVDAPDVLKYRPHAIFMGIVNTRSMLNIGLILLITGSLIGIYLSIVVSPLILILGITGIFLVYEYTGPPLKLKYRALGELSVFLAWGPLMALGSIVASTGLINYAVAIVSVPVALLVVATLYANNVRDIERDRGRGAYTLAIRLGSNAKWFYVALLASAYATQSVLILLRLLPICTLITIALIPLTIKMIRNATNGVFEHLDETTSLYSLAYTILLVIGLLIRF